MSLTIRLTKTAALATALFWTASAQAADPTGIWYDHNGRGAVQISECENGKGLCGFVVHVKEKKHAKRCGTQILGNVTSNGGGWIYSPSRGSKYTVRLKRLSDSKLRVVGNASSRLFSKTFTWKKAPDDVELCGKYAVAKKDERDAENGNDTKFSRKAVRRPTLPQSEIDELEAAAAKGDKSDYSERDNERVKDEDIADTPEEEVEQVEGEEGTADEPVENELTEVFDKLIDKANGYTGKLKRKCRLHIPYVDKVIMIPCKD